MTDTAPLTTSTLKFDTLVKQITDLAKTKKITLEDVQQAYHAVVDEKEAPAPDIAALLEELMKSGVEVDDGIDETQLAETAEQVIQDDVQDGDLDALSQWRRDALHHRILSRAEETELAHRILFYARTAESLERARGRLEAKIAEARANLARQKEILDLVNDDPESDADLGNSIRPQIESLSKEIAALETEIDRLNAECEAAKKSWREAKEVFLSFNHRLVLALAKNKWEQTGKKADLMDLIQQGELGMLEAIDKFDPTRGFKFSTFATWYINQKLSEWTHERVGTIRVPTHRWRDSRRITQIRYNHFEKHGENPSIEDIAEKLGKTPKKIQEILTAVQIVASTASLDKAISDDDDATTIGDLVADQIELSPEQIVLRKVLRSVFSDAFERVLNARERRVLQLRFGLYDDVPHTLEWIGTRMKITRERVRQIEAKALAKLRNDAIIRQTLGLESGEGQ